MKIEDILRTLERFNVRYAIVGGVAVVLYGYVRFTKDIDLVIDFSKDNIQRFTEAISKMHFLPEAPIDPMELADTDKRDYWIKSKNAKVISFYNPNSPLLKIDVLLIKKLSQINTIRKKIDDFEISVVDYDDLIKMKRVSGRQTDLIDIERLEELKQR